MGEPVEEELDYEGQVEESFRRQRAEAQGFADVFLRSPETWKALNRLPQEDERRGIEILIKGQLENDPQKREEGLTLILCARNFERYARDMVGRIRSAEQKFDELD